MKWFAIRRQPEQSTIDTVLSRALHARYANLSRRAFVSMVTRKVVGLTGIALAAEVLPFMAPVAHAQVSNPDCGLHGPKCNTGNCTNSGAQPVNRWVQCCPKLVKPCTQKYQCCTYTDWCATTPRPYNPSGCSGPGQSGTRWCSLFITNYWCTTVSCSGAYGDTSCGNLCGPPGKMSESWCMP
jgi:hypothetical protein